MTVTVKPPKVTVIQRQPPVTVTKSVIVTKLSVPQRLTVTATVEAAPVTETQTEIATETVTETVTVAGGSGNDSSGAGDTQDENGSGSDGGYTGPRCYAPGGKVWHPCP